MFTEKKPDPTGTISHTMWRRSCMRVIIEYLMGVFMHELVFSKVSEIEQGSAARKGLRFLIQTNECANTIQTLSMLYCVYYVHAEVQAARS